MYRRSDAEVRVLVHAPIGRDASLLQATLAGSAIACEVTPDAASLLSRIAEGAGAVIVSEESLSEAAVSGLADWLTLQPPWSDLPFIVLTFGGRPDMFSVARARQLQVLGNISLLERPVRPDTLLSVVRSALRARMRQYEMRRREEVLTRVNSDLEQFAHSASHDLQEPLRNVAIYSELLARRYGDALDEQGREFLGYLRSGALRMEMLVRDLLIYTRAGGIAEESPEAIDANEPLQAALLNLREAIKESGCQVLMERLPYAKINGIHLQQVFQNLIGNAIKYRGTEPPRVRVSAEKEGAFWLFSVEDNGIGIKPEYHVQIFAIFKRLHTADRYSGTGIGLAICQRIVERYRGHIWVESTLGAGSIFKFTVPV